MNARVLAPRFENGAELLLAGFEERFDHANAGRIPELWKRFGPDIGVVPGQIGHTQYGLMSRVDAAGLDYMACVAVSTFTGLPDRYDRVTVAPAAYAIFTHDGHISTLRRTMYGIWSEWLPASNYVATAAPSFERYDERFDPRTGNGAIEVWVPVASRMGASSEG